MYTCNISHKKEIYIQFSDTFVTGLSTTLITLVKLLLDITIMTEIGCLKDIYTFRKWACSSTPGVLKVLERPPIAITR